ncbi:MAG: site-specific DNA-methyltransferase [Fimbriimonadales bacterium]
MFGRVVQADNLDFLKKMESESVDLIYTDPPFNTGKLQERSSIRVRRAETGSRKGFGGRSYEEVKVGSLAFGDRFDDYLAFLEPRLVEAHRVLRPHGTFYLHLDYREVHYCKILLDSIFGRDCFLNEIIWAYDYGGRSKRRWPAKHDNILVYVKDSCEYRFNEDAVDRIPYMAPSLVSAEKAAKGKLPTDTWWHTIVSPTGKEKTGYPTQKPIEILRRVIAASSNEGDTVLDFFAGSGTTGAASLELGRNFILVDTSDDAIEIMRRRFSGNPNVLFEP